jgi:ABC-type transport system involved in multi-copper enzyme maturation permease subunit
MTTTEPALSAGRSEAPGPGRRRARTGVWLPTWELITTKNLEIRKRRGLMITMVVLIIVPTVLFYGLRLLFHAVDPHGYGLAGSPQFFSQATNLIDEFGFIAAAALGAAAGTTDLSDGMFRHLVITGRSRLALYLARIPAGLAITVPLVALAFLMNCLVTSYESPPNPTTASFYGVTAPDHLDQAGLQTFMLAHPQQEINGFLPGVPGGPGTTPTVAQVRSAIEVNIASYYGDYTTAQISESTPADNEMVKIGLWLELDVGIAFLVGLGFGALTGQRTTTVIVLIAFEIIVTPLLAHAQLPYFIDGQRLIIGVAMDQLRPAALAAASGPGQGGGGGILFGGRGAIGFPPMPTWAMVAVIAGWIVVWSGIGAWRMMTRDA